MILLVTTSDKIQLVTSAAVAVHAHASFMDGALSGGVLQNDMTPGRKNTLISTATTTDIVTSPGSNVCRNVKTLHIRNTHATSQVTVTVIHTDGTNAVELHSEVLSAGESLEYIEGIGFFKIEAKQTGTFLNASTSDQSIGASTTAYLVGSALVLPTDLKVGTVLRWTIQLGKSAAATATETIALRFGTAGTTADTARNTFTGDTETAAADEAVDYIQAIIRGPLSSSCIVESVWMRDSNLSTTGFSNTARKALIRQSTSAAFDITTAGLIVGVSIQTGSSHSLTVRQVVSEMLRP